MYQEGRARQRARPGRGGRGETCSLQSWLLPSAALAVGSSVLGVFHRGHQGLQSPAHRAPSMMQKECVTCGHSLCPPRAGCCPQSRLSGAGLGGKARPGPFWKKPGRCWPRLRGPSRACLQQVLMRDSRGTLPDIQPSALCSGQRSRGVSDSGVCWRVARGTRALLVTGRLGRARWGRVWTGASRACSPCLLARPNQPRGRCGAAGGSAAGGRVPCCPRPRLTGTALGLRLGGGPSERALPLPTRAFFWLLPPLVFITGAYLWGDHWA